MGQPQFAEHGPFFGLVRLHPAQDIVQNPHRADHMGTLVEHDALGTVSHCRVRNLGARRHPFLARVSRTWVAQITGTCAASQIQRISS